MKIREFDGSLPRGFSDFWPAMRGKVASSVYDRLAFVKESDYSLRDVTVCLFDDTRKGELYDPPRRD